MLKEMLALSDKGARDLKKGIAATAAAHLCVMLPVSLLMTMTMALIDKTVGRGSAESNIPFILLLCAFLTALIFVTQVSKEASSIFAAAFSIFLTRIFFISTLQPILADISFS